MIFLDMDQVLVDFNKGLEAFNIKNDTAFIHKPKSEWTALQVKLDKDIQDCMNTPGFFRDLPPMEGFHELYAEAEKLGDVKILTAWPKTTHDRKRIGKEKFDWLNEFLPEIWEEDFIYCAREDKALYAKTTFDNPNKGKPWFRGGYDKDKRNWVTTPNILIDDMISNCEAWTAAGGVSVLFENTPQSINALKFIHNLYKENSVVSA